MIRLSVQIYNLTSADITEIQQLGYKIEGGDASIFEGFMQKNFPNLNILKLCSVVETNFAPTTSVDIDRIIEFDTTSSTLKLSVTNKCNNEDDVLCFERQFSNIKGTISVEHVYCVLPLNFRRNGLIKPVFQESLQQYVNMNTKKIIVHSGLSGGGYVWAKYGFVATDKKEVNQILLKAKLGLTKSQYEISKRIYDNYYLKAPKGKRFPIIKWAYLDFMKSILMGESWHGELDLKNKEQLLNFTDYVFR